MHIHLQQQRAVECKRNDVAALHAAFAGLDAVLQVKARVGRLLRGRQLCQQGLCCRQRQFGVDGVVLTLGVGGLHANAGDFREENQLVCPQFDRHAGGNFFHAQVERLARGGETKGRQQHQRAHVQRALDTGHIHLAHQARVLEIHPIHNAHGPCGEKVT